MPRVLRHRVVMKRMGRNVDWDSQDGHHRVRLYGKWIPVPDESVITEPTRFAPAVVRPYLDSTETTRIRCFLPGAGGFVLRSISPTFTNPLDKLADEIVR